MLSPFKNQSFLFILVTAFLAVMGIGIIIPVIPFIIARYVGAENTNAIAFHVGVILSTYAFCQFFAAPGLGALSDHYGRKPVLISCLFGSAIGYILFGVGGSLFVLYIGRIIDGLTGGDIGAIFSYVADVTEPQDRGKNFGIIGGIVGLGFIIGPTIGGVLSQISLTTPFYVAAAICILNAIWGIFVLPESHKKENRTHKIELVHLNPFEQLGFALSIPSLKILLFMGFFYMLPFAQLQGNNAVLLKDTLHWTPSNIGYMFLLIGIIDIFAQGYLSGKLIPKLGETKLALIGLFLALGAYACYALLPFYPHLILALAGIVLFGFGSGCFEPAFNALISHTASPREQGRVQGANQSMQSLSRIIGPFMAATLYQFGWSIPSIISILLSIIGIGILLSNTKKIKAISISINLHGTLQACRREIV